MPPSDFRKFALFVFALIFTATVVGEDTGASLGPGGLNRILRGKWGLVQGTFTNSSDTEQEFLAVVIPADSHGLQYSRRVVVPAKSRRSCQWPVMVSDNRCNAFEFEYIVFDDPDGQGPIQRAAREEVTRSFSVLNPESRGKLRVSYRGLLFSGDEDSDELRKIERVADLFRRAAQQEPMGISLTATDLSGYPEALECLDQLIVTSRTLHEFPDACDAVRVWTQRGGRTWLCLDQTDITTVQALLGNTLPITKVDETSANVWKLDVAEDASLVRYPKRSLVREFDEPARLVRVIAEGGKVHWSIDGWPAVIEVPFGNGTVFVTTVSPEVLADLSDNMEPSLCAYQLIDRVFHPIQNGSPIGEEALSSAAAAFIGYEIPSRFFAAVVLFSFIAGLAVAGLWLLRKDASQALLWVVPVLALLCAVPAVWLGGHSRSVAPPTAIQQQVASVVNGQNTLSADGVASVFYPEPQRLDVRLEDFSLMTPISASTGNSPQRMVWTDAGESHWDNLEQAAGIRNYRIRSLNRLQQPGRVTLTLNEHGVIGRIEGDDVKQPADMILAGTAIERMSVRMNDDGSFQGTSDDLLAASEFVTGTLLSDTQKQRSAVYNELFQTAALDVAYPRSLTLFYWSDLNLSSIRIGDDTTRQAGSRLFIQEVNLQPPPSGRELWIPPALLPFKTVKDESGGLSGAFSNPSRKWQERENALATLLEFDVPDVCEPFDATGGTLTIRLNAGSRPVTISMGPRDSPVLLEELSSPAGLYTLPLSAEHLASIQKSGVVYLRLDVGKTIHAEADEDSVERDDGWKVERLMLSLKGVRIE
jgi:hypothetical protein